SSFTAEAGRSTTSPAAMQLIAASSSCRITGRPEAPAILGVCSVIRRDVAVEGESGKGRRLRLRYRAPCGASLRLASARRARNRLRPASGGDICGQVKAGEIFRLSSLPTYPQGVWGQNAPIGRQQP